MNERPRIILTYGTFDLFHVGHLKLLCRARGLGDKLLVGLSTDEFNAEKGKRSVFSYNERKQILEGIRYVDFVFPESNWNQKAADISNLNVTTLVMGDDWAGRFDDLRKYCDVVYLPRTSGISTTYIKNLMAQEKA